MLRPSGDRPSSAIRFVLALCLALACALALATPVFAAETLVGSGFESGADGAALGAPWVLSGTPQRAEFDSARAKVGALSGWIQGPAAASYAGAGETVSGGMTANGAEQRFWLYFDTANQFRVIDDWSATTADRAFSLQFDTAGAINVFTNRSGVTGYAASSYTPVGTYPAGWTEFRIVYDFASQSYQLSKRAASTDAWTRLKAAGASSYAIPFRGVNSISQSHGILWRAYNGANLWVDDDRFSDTGIADPDTTAPSKPASLVAADVAGDSGGAISLSWTAATDDVGVVGYKVYRGTASGSYGTPVTVFSTNGYTDSGVVSGTRYYYAVSAIDAAGNESLKSPEASAIAIDNLAPAAPSGLTAVGGTKQVALSWSANAESDLAGYNVYRAGAKLNTSPLTARTYTDTGLADGTSYSYTVTAVDASGNESPASGSASATTAGTAPVPVGATLVGAGFESGADGTALSAPWVLSGTPQRAELDTARNRGGATSGWIAGPAAAAYGGFGEKSSAGMSASGAEQRFWVYCDTANQFRVVDDWSSLTADRAFTIQFDTGGAINAYTNRSGVTGYTANSYTPVGTYSAGWTEFRIVYDFASQSYQLSKRSNTTDTWTRLKAAGASSYAIPFRGANAIGSSHGLLWRAYNGANMWIDDVYYSASGISEYVVTASAGAGGTVSPASQVVYGGCDASPVAITPNAGYMIANVTVDGVSVGTVTSYTAKSVAASHSVVASFKVKPASGDISMEGIDCDSCHAEPATGHGFGVACGECHDMAVKHPGTPTQMHVASDVSNCACHNASLTTEHNRVTKAGELITCATCHNSTDPEVVAAIAAKDSACTACHANPDHRTVHAKTNSAFCAQSGCHEPSNLIDEHITDPIKPERVMTCETCHDSTDAAVVNSIATGNRDCTSCHGQMLSGHDAMHETVMEPECLHCHSGSVSAEHIVLHNTGGARTCATCHDSTEQRIVDAISSHEKNCSACHADAGHNVAHSADFTGQDCANCHEPDLQVEHLRSSSSSAANRCANCHSEPKSTSVFALDGAAWAKGCAQGGCHAAGGATQQHGNTSAAHAPASPAPSCVAVGCHATTDISVLHASATTTTAGVTKTGCMVCHSTSALPTKDCATCHPDRVTPHGYVAEKHQASETCVAGCHQTELGPVHATKTCADCHAAKVAEIKPWDKSCRACHGDPSHQTAAAKHVGNDIGAGSSVGYGCTGLPGMRCHIITNVATLHANVHDGSGGCTICHGAGKTPSTACVTCHLSGSTGGTNGVMHHDNNKYVANPADVVPGSYYASDPAGGWDDNLTYYDCQWCHADFFGGIQTPPNPISPYAGSKMWYSGLRSAAGSLDDTQLQSGPIDVPAGASLDFMTSYDIEEGFDYGYIEVSTDGTTWSPIAGTGTTTDDPYGANLGNGITGSSGGWIPAHFDLAPYAGQQIEIRFRFVSDSAVNLAGWAVDDIALTTPSGPLFTDNAESASTTFTSNGWLRVGPYPPAFLPDDPAN